MQEVNIMPEFDVRVDFTLEEMMRITASNRAEAEVIVLGATNEQITEIQGKSYADVKDTIRKVISVTEVTG